MLGFLISIAGAAALLIWAVRLVRTGVERAFAPELRVLLRRSSGSRLLASGSGLLSALVLQSATAVTLLVSNFVAKGTLGIPVGLAIILGADLGSALVAQALMLRHPILVPTLLLFGVVMFLKGGNRRFRQSGRILVGLGLIFLSLDMLRTATTPLLDSETTLGVLTYLETDLLAAFAIGAVFAWALHSSVAAVLFFATLAAQGVLPVSAAMAMVLGANLGGAMIAYTLTLAAAQDARRLVLGNIVLRGGGAVVVLFALIIRPEMFVWFGGQGATQVITLHMAFNFGLCVALLPFVGPIGRVTGILVAPPKQDAGASHPTSLDPGALDDPARALSCAAREVMKMGERVEAMLSAMDGLFDDWNDPTAELIRRNDKIVRNTHMDIKLYLAELNRRELDGAAAKEAMDLSILAANLETASDILARNLVGLARRLHSEGISFSDRGRREISAFHDRVLANVQLGLKVLMTRNPDDARELVAQKEDVREAEQNLQRKHLGRLRDGLAESIETSSIHQETLRALKQINTSFAMAGYPILMDTGDLLSSRLSN